MTELSYSQQCDEIQAKIDALNVKFKKHYEEVIKPALPEFLATAMENMAEEMDKMQGKYIEEFNKTKNTAEGLKVMQQSYEGFKALCKLQGVEED